MSSQLFPIDLSSIEIWSKEILEDYQVWFINRCKFRCYSWSLYLMSLKRVIHLVDGLQRVTLKNNSVSTIAKATYRTAFIGSASMCGYLFSYWLSVTLRIDFTLVCWLSRRYLRIIAAPMIFITMFVPYRWLSSPVWRFLFWRNILCIPFCYPCLMLLLMWRTILSFKF